MEPLLGLLSEFAMPLDGEYLIGKLSQDGRRLARARANLQDAIRRLYFRCFRHPGDDEGLRDRLAAPDGQRAILISEFFEAFVHECFTGNMPKGRKDALIAHASPRDMRFDHSVPGVLIVEHHHPSARRL